MSNWLVKAGILECIWAFVQGHRNAKPGNEVSWSGLSEADEAELQARLMATNWVREIINQSAEVVRPSQLASRAGEFIKSLSPGTCHLQNHQR